MPEDPAPVPAIPATLHAAARVAWSVRQEDDPFEAAIPATLPDAVEEDRIAERTIPGTMAIERMAIHRAIQATGFDGNFDTLSSNEEQRVRLLLHYRDRVRLHKPHLIASEITAGRLDTLAQAQPNFAGVTALVHDAAQLSLATQTPMRVTPLLLLGPPGVGKTRFARALAQALDTTLDTIDGATIPDMGSIVGYPPVWRAAGPGYAAKALVQATSSAPLILCDEIEKVVDHDRNPHPANKLLGLLERHTARVYQDEFIRVPMNAAHAIWIFTANSTTGLSAPFLDRVVTVAIPRLSRAARDAVLEAMLAEVAGEIGLPVTIENRTALHATRPLGLRRARLAIELAVAHAVADGRRVLSRDDLVAAALRLRARATSPRMPAQKPTLRGPVGFIDLRRPRFVSRQDVPDASGF
ncbi:AAA family ATPase [Lichenihabitans sp. Uapishka_5]|uniref:AAA family ATPase n=1 Tax=Lichenihabitans sp. Uapishka_5 TaxID=3037302 RepID=UPI0029E7F8D0|nr:AAA family ATPase [Lichenihabitans sp. Uapishka_5]MDX7949742.1 AAA family ATPase [Lichenihabitans sp. Uapishka_5]